MRFNKIHQQQGDESAPRPWPGYFVKTHYIQRFMISPALSIVLSYNAAQAKAHPISHRRQMRLAIFPVTHPPQIPSSPYC